MNPRPRTWRIDAAGQTLVLASEGDTPAAVYWGPSLPECDLAAVAAQAQTDVTGGMMDRLPPISLCPVEGDSLHAQPALVAYRAGQMLRPQFELITGDGLSFAMRDEALGLSLSVNFEVIGGVIQAQSTLQADEPIVVHHFAAPVLPGPQSGEIQHFSGRWIGEFQMQSNPWRPGVFQRESRSGRSGHEHPPLAFFCEEGCTNTQGTAFGMHYGWPGGHVMLAEELPDGRRQIQWGHATGTQVQGTRFETAPLLLSVSVGGLNGCGVSFQRHIRDHTVTWPKPDAPRPVHYNCWEAIYFDHDLETLKDIADRAADLGAERFVLDDGWFGTRDDDTSSLGDWEIDPRKWPDGLAPIIEHLASLGMVFGLWFEPEMVNVNSNLARAHPEWILGRVDQIEGRQQRVLDMARAEVRDYLFDKISAVLSTHDIDYIKWDHNRLLPVPDAAQANGTLELMHRLRKAHPQVEIESCASGGGRIDSGIMTHTQRVWLSDSNDALERLRIQHEAALLLPLAVTGSHVGPRRCHTSGRVMDIRFRAWVAAQRHMGFEMDPRELTQDEAQVLRDVTTWWKDNRSWMCRADILRLDSHDPSVLAEQQLAEDGSRFVVFSGKATSGTQILPRPLRLTGLTPDATYRITLKNRGDAPGLSRATPALKEGPVELNGEFLMRHGLTLPWSFPEAMWVLEGELL
ncbi:alpha-galactosidase [Pelagimonas varians]|uniref:alpha-galactosidase n=1 Tax=Pelagimonas varians TaxID=696760 RepID=A0A238KJX7_9RHOB|nr:alpha-galactosidase [Pelagimonas varians]PYG29249.1 alpha-galactosidase [Pelagimonas varians]SMX43149.1 Alpha-galactosidase [Pelagimonas varians]